MINPNTPENEASRLDTLRSLKILDTHREERFDRIVRMAKRVFDVPIALISLIDENRQWFKACVGLDVNETSREVSFCGHAILDDNVLVVSNALNDERFADNPLVLGEPNIRFYAGAPLKALDGNKLGTLCIIDRNPRQLSNEDIETLSDLAAIVEREIATLQMATIDHLTSISNRTGFMMLARHSFNVCIRQNIPASMIFLDLNNLKLINDKLGHGEGDNTLIAFANQIKSNYRSSDIFARLGGDEFVVLLNNSTKLQAEATISRLRASIKQYNIESNRVYNISFSYGIVELDPVKHLTVESLLAEADAQMYEHKSMLKAGLLTESD